jgi:RNA polymerase sigma factor (sigma-70 family)
MKEFSDSELLGAYARERSEDAFRELVARHVDLIYSAAMRQLRNPHLAEEATQSAFIALAGKARQLRGTTVIAGWLHRAVRFAALNLQRGESRRKRREEQAASMNTSEDTDQAFRELALPHVDGALAELGDNDRDAVVLRFLKQQSFRDLAQTLGTSEDAAKKRVSRALEKLRGLLAQRGVAVSSAALAGGLSQLPVTAAPPSMSSTLAALAVSSAPSSTTIGAVLGTAKARVAIGAVAVILIGAAIALWLRQPNQNTTAASNPMTTSTPQIKLASVMVDDQDKALKFYTEVLGFIRKNDTPTGEPGGARWLTVVSPEEPGGTELLLEPIGFAFAKTYQKALFDAGRPWLAFATGDVRKQFERLKSLGVKFSAAPTETTTSAVFEDTCGNRHPNCSGARSGRVEDPPE